MMLLASVDQFDDELAQFWTRVQGESAEQRAASFQISSSKKGRRRRRKRRKPPSAKTSS